jgi:hypothetical protein
MNFSIILKTVGIHEDSISSGPVFFYLS